MRTVSINKHLKLRIMRRRAVEGLTVRDSDTSPLTFKCFGRFRAQMPTAADDTMEVPT